MAAIQIYLHQINSFPYFNLDVIRPPQSLLDMDHFVHGIYITLLYILHHFLEGSLFSDIVSPERSIVDTAPRCGQGGRGTVIPNPIVDRNS